MTIDKILDITDDNQLIIAIGQLISTKTKDLEDLGQLSESEKVFVYVDILERQVNNGGFDQFFNNYSGQYSHEALDSYRKIYATKTADIIERAISMFPTLPIPKDTELRRQIMMTMDEDISDKWNELDNEFYKYEENILKLLIDYIKENKSEFE